jgi:hypothetical protein
MCLPTRAHNIRNLDSSLGARRHVRGALTTLFNLKRVVQREEKGQSGLIKGFYPQQTSLYPWAYDRLSSGLTTGIDITRLHCSRLCI